MEENKINWVDKIILRSQNWRAIYFKKILIVLTNLKITANGLTNFRLLLGVFGIGLYLFFYRYNWALNILLVAILLDLFDGPLARFQNKNSDRGKFLDIFTDYILYCFVLVLIRVISGHSGYVYYNLFILPILFLLATIKKQEFANSDWIVKPAPRLSYLKDLVLAAFYSHWYLDTSLVWIDKILLIINILATILCIYYFIYIQLRWRKLKM
jgi:phosphatidylglycerophosphate synthase